MPTLYSQWRDLIIEIEAKIPGFELRHEAIISRISRMLQMYAITQDRLAQMSKEM